MKRMKDSCCMAWLVLSTSSLLDERTSSSLLDGTDVSAVPQDKLESLVRRSGYKPVTLQNIMRNSSNIATATKKENVGICASAGISKSISSGSCSTVTGTRPTCYLYEYSSLYEFGDFVKKLAEEMATCVKDYLDKTKLTRL